MVTEREAHVSRNTNHNRALIFFFIETRVSGECWRVMLQIILREEEEWHADCDLELTVAIPAETLLVHSEMVSLNVCWSPD